MKSWCLLILLGFVCRASAAPAVFSGGMGAMEMTGHSDDDEDDWEAVNPDVSAVQDDQGVGEIFASLRNIEMTEDKLADREDVGVQAGLVDSEEEATVRDVAEQVLLQDQFDLFGPSGLETDGRDFNKFDMFNLLNKKPRPTPMSFAVAPSANPDIMKLMSILALPTSSRLSALIKAFPNLVSIRSVTDSGKLPALLVSIPEIRSVQLPGLLVSVPGLASFLGLTIPNIFSTLLAALPGLGSVLDINLNAEAQIDVVLNSIPGLNMVVNVPDSDRLPTLLNLFQSFEFIPGLGAAAVLSLFLAVPSLISFLGLSGSMILQLVFMAVSALASLLGLPVAGTITALLSAIPGLASILGLPILTFLPNLLSSIPALANILTLSGQDQLEALLSAIPGLSTVASLPGSAQIQALVNLIPGLNLIGVPVQVALRMLFMLVPGLANFLGMGGLVTQTAVAAPGIKFVTAVINKNKYKGGAAPVPCPKKPWKVQPGAQFGAVNFGGGGMVNLNGI